MEAPQQSAMAYSSAELISIMSGPDEKFHQRNSFLDAFMDPARFEFSSKGIQFKHYEYAAIKYSLSWDQANNLLNTIVADMGKLIDEEKVMPALESIKNNSQKLTEEQKYSFQIIHSTLHYGHLDLKNTDGSLAVRRKVIYDRNRYRDAFSSGKWKDVRKYSEKRMNLASHFPNLTTRIQSFVKVGKLQEYLKSVAELKKSDSIYKKREDVGPDQK